MQQCHCTVQAHMLWSARLSIHMVEHNIGTLLQIMWYPPHSRLVRHAGPKHWPSLCVIRPPHLSDATSSDPERLWCISSPGDSAGIWILPFKADGRTQQNPMHLVGVTPDSAACGCDEPCSELRIYSHMRGRTDNLLTYCCDCLVGSVVRSLMLTHAVVQESCDALHTRLQSLACFWLAASQQGILASQKLIKMSMLQGNIRCRCVQIAGMQKGVSAAGSASCSCCMLLQHHILTSYPLKDLEGWPAASAC